MLSEIYYSDSYEKSRSKEFRRIMPSFLKIENLRIFTKLSGLQKV